MNEVPERDDMSPAQARTLKTVAEWVKKSNTMTTDELAEETIDTFCKFVALIDGGRFGKQSVMMVQIFMSKGFETYSAALDVCKSEGTI